jgi:GTP-binding protein Era
LDNKGEAIKKVGTEARIDLEKFFRQENSSQSFCKVKKDWRKMKETSKISVTDKTKTQQFG